MSLPAGIEGIKIGSGGCPRVVVEVQDYSQGQWSVRASCQATS